MSEQAVTAQSEDFSRWYNEIVYRADLAAPSPVRGCVIIKPYGYEIWEAIKAGLDRRFKATGSTVSAETCPHYLFFNEADLARCGPYAKINPPLRREADQVALWDGLLDGTLLAITTDHSPFTVDEKERAREDIWATPPGAPGVEELLLAVMHEALNGRISINMAVDLVATNGAKRFGLYPERGHIGIGAAADLVIYDPEAETTIHRDMLFTQARDCDKLYDGMTFKGAVERTIVNGVTVFQDGNIVGSAGDGQFLRPDAARVTQVF